MRRFFTGLAIAASVVVFAACSNGPDRLLKDGADAMNNLDADPALNEAKIGQGIESLSLFLDRHLHHEHADSALFMLATLQEIKGDRRDAAQNHLRLVREYPTSSFRSKSLILAGHIYEGLNDFNRARAAYERLIREFPEDEFVTGGSAQWLLDNIGRPIQDWPVPYGEDAPRAPETTVD